MFMLLSIFVIICGLFSGRESVQTFAQLVINCIAIEGLVYHEWRVGISLNG